MNGFRIGAGMVLIALLQGCAIGNDMRLVQHRYTTLGQELIDLEKARNDKLISEEEYQKMREQIIDGGEIEIDQFTD